MKKGLRTVGSVAIWVFVAIAAAITVVVFTAQKSEAGLPNIFGKMPVSVLSDSMKPTFKKGDLLIETALKTEEKSKLEVGQVITFFTDLNGDSEAELNTHRIVEVTKDGGYVYYTTKGDNKETNPVNDQTLVRYDQVQGLYSGTRLGGIGAILNFLKTPNGFLLCIVAPLILFFLYELYRFIVTIVAMKAKPTLTTEQEDEIKQKAVAEYLNQQNNKKDE